MNVLRSIAVTAAAALLLVVLGVTIAPPPTASAAPENLVANASLEAGAWPDCFHASGWGSEGEWAFVDGHDGDRAVAVTIGAYTGGDRKLLQTESDACAPAVAAGSTYELGVWYSSTVPVQLTAFRHDATGWTYWADFAVLPASATWSQAVATTPAVPDGTDRMVFGLALSASGTLVTDDYSLWATGTDEPEVPTVTDNLIVNPDLAEGSGDVPDCFMLAGWGDNGATGAISADVPATSPAGARSFTISMAGRSSGDAKLLQSEAPGCAPGVTAGTSYELAVSYRSTSAATGLTAFQHTATGWSYWTELGELPPTSGWESTTVALPVVPDTVDRVAFGVSVAADGELSTTGYALRAITPDPDPGPDPAGDPAEIGSWEVLDAPMPVRAIHTTLLHDGRVLLVAGSGNDGTAFAAGSFTAVVWNPADDTYLDVPVPYDMFCAGHVTLPDGKVLLTGGTEAFPEEDQGPNTFKGSRKSYYFDPADDQFHPTADMAGAHWYPTLTKLGNGDLWAAGGLDEKAEGTVLTEIFDSSEMRWLAPGEVPQTWSFWGTYPHMYLLDDGMLFYAGGHTFGNGLPGTGASLYDWTTAQMWDVPGLRQKDLRDQAGSVLLPPAQDQRVMIVGGGNTDSNVPAINLVDIIDLSLPAPEYTPAADLPGPGKAYVNVLNLPDRTVLAADGARLNRADDVLTAAIFDPVTNAWTSIGPDPVGRNYHSTSLVLPDGRVAVFGSNPADNSFEQRISIYLPAYLHRGERPTITSAPQTLTYGEVFDLQLTGDVTSASLMSPMSSTHQTDTNARLVDLPIVGAGDTRTAQVPANPNLLPPGPYMLTVLDADGVPSTAEWVWVQ
ncbi:galactose oxidase-like domain-containing protein [Microbacterium sp.]|uniref:galactose oxidase-like domain-containing protein n=1 Tax=Microbacterium sp. TaxID=51671 RepID=UPI0039E38D6F